jgi:hypothetical protein
MAKKATGKGSHRMTPKQRKLALLLPEVEDGKMTLKAAILKAGYAESTALQQERAVGSVRNNAKMQEALAKKGFNEDFIAGKIMEGVEARNKGTPDWNAQHKYLATGVELMDLFPAKKIDATVNQPLAYDELEQPKAKTPEEARKLAK